MFPLRSFRYTVLTLLFPPLLGLGLSGCGANSQAENTKPEAPPTLPVAQLVARDTVLSHEYVADIQAVRNVEIRARVEGFLEQIYVDEGKPVRKGQLLFRINDAPYKTQLSQARAVLGSAKAQAQVAKLELSRVQLLTAKNIISKTELDVAQAKYCAAQAQIDEARSAETAAALSLSYTQVRAPFDGVINRIPLKMGSVIEDGTLLTTVSDTRAVYAYFNVSEAEYLEYTRNGQQDSARSTNNARLVLADGSTYNVKGKIETVEGQFQANTGSIAFRARFDNPDKLLRHGASGKVRITNTVSDAVLVPQKAVFEIQDKNYVFLVDNAGKVQQHEFKPKTRLATYYLVASGLKPGQRVVCEGTQDLRNGAQITPRMVTLSSLVSVLP
ncbi:membrane fusion protein, multidrug efflux system [Hymenobacter gelipurpurascens]|uniref:Membrane fusion protein, multidrug efflux system n=1 Tax=Hymenobacter gelipurpurascens TaxID=89968 RepID=A0A212TFK1_9BACT|nr:efflux RND transporter periplasmic adaptor subunit [Hymenobacter gelipurpurascens]SNC64848.1 membrane fusion protein, multidrug efflux system [Hymenobacter gelipurpurascens]